MARTVEIVIKASDQATGVVGRVQGALGGLGNVARGVLTAGLAAGAVGVGALVAVLGSSVKAAMDAQAGQAQLAAVLKSTGGAAGMTVDSINALAQSISEVTPFEDDAVVAGEAMLLTFTNIGKDVFPATTQAMVDMSQAMGTDLQGSAIMLGKALNDPVAGISALTRVGVTFTEEQKAVIAKLVETGDVAGAQKVILAELQKEFGGSAVAAGQTFAGQLEILKNSLGNVQEEIGMALLPILTDLLHAVGPILTDALNWLKEAVVGNVPAVEGIKTGIQDFIDGPGTAIVTILGAIAKAAIEVLGPALSGLATIAGDVVAWFITNWPTIQSTVETVFTAIQTAISTVLSVIMPIISELSTDVATWFTENWPAIQSTVEGVIGAVSTAIDAAVAFIMPIISQLAKDGTAWVKENWPAIQTTIENVMEAVKAVINTVINEVVPFIKTELASVTGWVTENWPLIQETTETIFNAVQTVVKAVIDAVQTKIKTVLGEIKEFWKTNHEAIETIATTIWKNLKTFIDTTINAILGIIKTVMLLIKGDWKGAWEEIKGVGETIWTGIKTIIDTTIHAMLDIIKGVLGDIKASIVGKWEEIKGYLSGINLSSIGSNIMHSMIGGINGAIGAIADAVRNAIAAAIQAAKNALGILPPSKAFAAIGADTMAGLALGIKEQTPIVVGEASEVVKLLTDVFNFGSLLSGGMGGIPTGAVDSLIIFLESILDAFRQIVGTYGDKLKAAAQDVADSLGPALKVLADAVTLQNALSDMASVEDVRGKINDLMLVVEIVIIEFQKIAVTYGKKLQDVTKELVDSIGPAFKLLMDALTLRNALADWNQDVVGLVRDRIAVLASVIGIVAQEFNRIAGWAGTKLSEDAMKLAESMPVVIAAFKAAHELRQALEEWTDDVKGTVAARIEVLGSVIALTAQRFNEISEWSGTQLTENAKKVAGGISGVLSAMTAAAKLRSELGKWTTDVGDVPARIDVLGSIIGLTAQRFNEVAEWYGTDLTTKAKNIGDGISNMLKAMVDAFKLRNELAKWEPGTIVNVQGRIDVLGSVLGMVAQRVNEVAKWYGTELDDSAIALAGGIGEVLKAFTEAGKLRNELAEWEGSKAAGEVLRTFSDYLQKLADIIHKYAVLYSSTVVTDMMTLLDAFQRIQGMMPTFAPITIGPGQWPISRNGPMKDWIPGNGGEKGGGGTIPRPAGASAGGMVVNINMYGATIRRRGGFIGSIA